MASKKIAASKKKTENDSPKRPKGLKHWWNYRLVRPIKSAAFWDMIRGDYVELAEVYYDVLDGKGLPNAYCEASLGGDDPEEVRRVLESMAMALEKPVLNASEILKNAEKFKKAKRYATSMKKEVKADRPKPGLAIKKLTAKMKK